MHSPHCIWSHCCRAMARFFANPATAFLIYGIKLNSSKYKTIQLCKDNLKFSLALPTKTSIKFRSAVLLLFLLFGRNDGHLAMSVLKAKLSVIKRARIGAYIRAFWISRWWRALEFLCSRAGQRPVQNIQQRRGSKKGRQMTLVCWRQAELNERGPWIKETGDRERYVLKCARAVGQYLNAQAPSDITIRPLRHVE